MPYQVKLLHKDLVARGTIAFTFEKPDGYTFLAGQATDWTLIDPPETDAEGNSRSFSIARAPSSGTVRIATRMRDTAFKRVLGKMEPGDTIQMDDPWGEFVIDKESTKPLVFLCGGIGITPFLSIIEEAISQRDPRSMTLFFSNKEPDDVPFRDELLAYERENPSLKIVETIAGSEGDISSWKGERGFIDWPMIGRHLETTTDAIFYIAGPPQMVAAMNKMLEGAKVAAEQIMKDDFLGY